MTPEIRAKENQKKKRKIKLNEKEKKKYRTIFERKLTLEAKFIWIFVCWVNLLSVKRQLCNYIEQRKLKWVFIACNQFYSDDCQLQIIIIIIIMK